MFRADISAQRGRISDDGAVRRASRRCLLAATFFWIVAVAASAQGWTNGGGAPITGLPFVFDQTVGAKAAGWYLNTNDDGVRNFGEMGTDLGGAGAAFSDPRTNPIPVVFRIVPETFTSPNGAYRFKGRRIVGELYGKTILIIDPGVPIGASPPQWGRCARDFEINHPPTRIGSPHAFGPLRDFGPIMSQFFLRGAMVGQVIDQRADHPLIESTQNALYLAEIARRQFGRSRVYVTGGSYGSAAALIQVMQFPDRFDGCYGSGGALSFAEYDEWNHMYRILEASQGRLSLVSPLVSDIDGAMTVSGWSGRTPWNLDLNSIAGLSQIRKPVLITLGGSDGNQITNGQVEEVMAKARALGIDGYFQIDNPLEAGHALRDPYGPGCAPGGPMGPSPEERFLGLMDNFGRPPASLPTPIAMAYRRTKKYDSFLLERKTSDIQTPPPGPRLLTLEDRIGPEAGVFGQVGGGVLRDNSIYFGDRAGWVYKKTFSFSTNTFVEQWRSFVGMSVKSVVVADLANGTFVLTGSQRGLSVLQESTGALVREKGPQNGGFGDVRSIVVGSIIPGQSSPQIVYQALRMKLVVDDASSGQTLHTQEIGLATRLVIPPNGNRLYAALSRGHVVCLEFSGSGPYQMRCTAASPYLAMTPSDLVYASSGGSDYFVTAPLDAGDGGPQIYYLDAQTLAIVRRIRARGVTQSIVVKSGQVLVPQNGQGFVAYSFPAGVEIGRAPLSTRWIVGPDAGTTPGAIDLVSFGEADAALGVWTVGTGTLSPIATFPGRFPTVAATHYRKTSNGAPRHQVSFFRETAGPSSSARTGMQFVVDTGDIVYNAALQKWRIGPALSTPVYQTAWSNGVTALDNPGNYPACGGTPMILVRRGDDETSTASFDILSHAGGASDFGTGVPAALYDSSCGRMTTFPTRQDLNDYGITIGFGNAMFQDICFTDGFRGETGDRRAQTIPVPATVGKAGYDYGAMDGSPIAVDYIGAVASKMVYPDLPGGCAPGPQWGILASSFGGSLHAIDADVCNLLPNFDPSGLHYTRIDGLGQGIMAIATDDVGANPDGVDDFVYVGSLLPDANGRTLYVFDATLAAPLAAVAAGHIVGIAPAGSLYPSSPSREFVVGFANGDIAIYSFNPAATRRKLQLVHRENLGVLTVGARKSMQVMKQSNGDILIGAAVDGGYMLLKVNVAMMPALTWI